MEIREEVLLGPLTTFGVGGKARWFVEVRTEQDVEKAVAWARERGVPLFVLGGGSNLLVRDEGFAGLVVRVEIGGVVECGDGLMDVGAGESWDGLVDRAVGMGLAGIECLAGIPGSVGGTPVQNVGAYGQEVSETIESVRAFDRVRSEWVELEKADCRFRYRESLFNTDEPGRYIVTRVRFQLRAGGPPTLKYAELRTKCGEGATPTLAEVAAAVREIRHGKGMLIVEGETDCRSAGSFFKNPVVGVEALERVKAAVDGAEVPHWSAGEGLVKIPAAWLLEKAGFVKGYGDGPVGISSRHTLALVNRGGATFADIARIEGEIVRVVREQFGVLLVREPVVLG
jgi:UDP-N-acetylmuramate dehydrogenase